MIYQPISVSPLNSVLDMTEMNNFFCLFSGDKLVAYQAKIYESNSGNILYTGSKTNCEIYNGDSINISIPANSVTNGKSLLWNITLYQDNPNMFITSGTVQSGSTTTTIKMRSHPSVKAGMYINISGEQRQLSSYSETTLFKTGTVGSGSTVDEINVGTGLTLPSSCSISINGETRDIVTYNSETGMALTDYSFDTAAATTDTFNIYDLSLGTGVVSNAFTSVPSAKTKYNIYSDFVESPRYYFSSKTKPSVSITTIPNPLSSRKHTFSGVYTQSEGVEIKYHVWNLYDENHLLIDSTGKKYSSNLKYSFDGFISGNSYKTELICETQDGVVVTSGVCEFSVSYTSPITNSPPKISFLEDKNAVKISYYDAKQTSGDATDCTYQILQTEIFPTGCVNIQSGEIVYTQNKLNRISTYILDVSISQIKQGVIFEIIDDVGTRFVSVDGYDIHKSIDGVDEKIHNIFPNLDFALTKTGISDPYTGYLWDDSFTWNDSYVWTETNVDISKYKYRFVVTPEDIILISFKPI